MSPRKKKLQVTKSKQKIMLITFKGVWAKLQKATINFVKSVCLSVHIPH
jgi:predicted aconitase